MRAAVVREHGGPDRLTFENDFPDPKPGEGDVIVAVKASSLNYHDVFTRRGMPGINLNMPLIMGIDVAGEVAALGEGVLGRHRLLVRAHAGHDVPGVGRRQHAGTVGDLLAGQPVGVSGAVVALVVAPHPAHLLGAQHLADDLGAQRGVGRDGLVLVRREGAGLEEDPVGHADLADVVHERRLAERRGAGDRPAQRRGELHGEIRDALGVQARGGVLRVHHPREQADTQQGL